MRAYVGAFLEVSCTGAASKAVWIGADLRASSPIIASRVASAARQAGWEPFFAGPVPTPALALHALSLGVPAIMVTGSHIPADYNGLKFYRPDGELLKSDEGPIRDRAEELLDEVSHGEGDDALSAPDPVVANAYRDRFASTFPADALTGKRIGVFEHSAVGRDLLIDILGRLGAVCVPFGRSATFVAVDTEAVADDHMAQMRAVLAAQDLDAVVSTDGDGDRPLVLDETGAQINGDVLGALTARALGAGTVVIPLTSTSGIEMTGWFETIVRTRIGSPYVVEAMSAHEGVVGFEANGGFLTGSEFALSQGFLDRLPTRDAVLPIVAVLAETVARRQPVSALAASLPSRFMRADRLKNIAPKVGNQLVVDLAGSEALRSRIDAMLADPVEIDTLDGTRLVLRDGTVVHFRQSGNAPEFRCYVETGDRDQTEAVLRSIVSRLQGHFHAQEG